MLSCAAASSPPPNPLFSSAEYLDFSTSVVYYFFFFTIPWILHRGQDGGWCVCVCALKLFEEL